MNYLFKTLLIYLVVFLVVGCKKNTSSTSNPTPASPPPSSQTVNVFHTLTLNSHNYGVSSTINLPYDVSWDTKLTSSGLLTINLPYVKPGSSTVYSSMTLFITNPSMGSNSATFTLAGGCDIYRETNSFKVNFTHLASGIGDYYSGSFSGNIEITNICTMTSNVYPSSGNFKVYLE